MGYKRTDLPASGGNFMKAASLGKQKLRVTIASIEMQEFDGKKKDEPPQQKFVLGFNETDEMFVCNVTNANIMFDEIADDTDGWIGHQIILYVGQTKMGPGIKVKVPEVAAAAPVTSKPLKAKPVVDEEEPADDEEWE